MPTLELPLPDAKLMASALLPHTDRTTYHDDPLTCVAVGHDIPEGGQYAVASDRYTAARYDLTNVATVYPDEVMLIPVRLLSALLTVGPATLPNDPHTYKVRITISGNAEYPDNEALAQAWLGIYRLPPEGLADDGILHYLRVFDATDQRKAFPPVARLLDQWVFGEPVLNPVVVNPDYLARFTSFASRTRKKMRVTMPPVRGKGSQQAILVETGTRFKGIIMPFLIYDPTADFGVDVARVNTDRANALSAEATIAGEAAVGEPSQDTDGE